MAVSTIPYVPKTEAPVLGFDFAAALHGDKAVDAAIAKDVSEKITKWEFDLKPADRDAALAEIRLNGSSRRAVTFAMAATQALSHANISRAETLSSSRKSGYSVPGQRPHGDALDEALQAIAELQRNGFDPSKAKSMVWSLFAKGHRAHYAAGHKGGPKSSSSERNFIHASFLQPEDPEYVM